MHYDEAAPLSSMIKGRLECARERDVLSSYLPSAPPSVADIGGRPRITPRGSSRHHDRGGLGRRRRSARSERAATPPMTRIAGAASRSPQHGLLIVPRSTGRPFKGTERAARDHVKGQDCEPASANDRLVVDHPGAPLSNRGHQRMRRGSRASLIA